MAAEDVERARTLANVDAQFITNVDLQALITSMGSVYGAVAELWRRKAADAAELVDTSESGSSRRMSQVYDNARKMAEQYEAMANPPALAVVPGRRSRVRPIERI